MSSSDPPLPDPSEDPSVPSSRVPQPAAPSARSSRNPKNPKAKVSSGLANRRHPLLIAMGDAALVVRKALLSDPIKLFLGVVSVGLAIAFFVLLGSIGPS